MRTDTEWLALAMTSEANQPHEWPFVGWIIRNRQLARGSARVVEVVLAPLQFSFFNEFQGSDPERIFDLALGRYPAKQFAQALPCAQAVLAAPLWSAPFGRDVRHYWSPVSMVPKGSRPAWATAAKRLFTPSGLDPDRFVFAAGVP